MSAKWKPEGRGKLTARLRRQNIILGWIWLFTIAISVTYIALRWSNPALSRKLLWLFLLAMAPFFIYQYVIRRTVRELAAIGDDRSLGPLAEQLGADTSATRTAEQAIIDLSKRRDFRFPHLTDRQLACLLVGLESGRREVALAILLLFGHVRECHHSDEVVEKVSEIAEGRGRGRKDRHLREAAEQCLAAIERV